MAMVALRLRSGLGKELDPGSLLSLPPADGPSVRMAVAQKVASNVKSSNSTLRAAQKELYWTVALLGLSILLWVITVLVGQP